MEVVNFNCQYGINFTSVTCICFFVLPSNLWLLIEQIKTHLLWKLSKRLVSFHQKVENPVIFKISKHLFPDSVTQNSDKANFEWLSHYNNLFENINSLPVQKRGFCNLFLMCGNKKHWVELDWMSVYILQHKTSENDIIKLAGLSLINDAKNVAICRPTCLCQLVESVHLIS